MPTSCPFAYIDVGDGYCVGVRVHFRLALQHLRILTHLMWPFNNVANISICFKNILHTVYRKSKSRSSIPNEENKFVVKQKFAPQFRRKSSFLYQLVTAVSDSRIGLNTSGLIFLKYFRRRSARNSQKAWNSGRRVLKNGDSWVAFIVHVRLLLKVKHFHHRVEFNSNWKKL